MGDKMVALIMELSVNPMPIPVARIPLARPSWRDGNQVAINLKILAEIKTITEPNKKVVNNRAKKSFASPLEAPANPAIEQEKIRMRFAPKRSARIPASKKVNKPDSGKKPHIQPI